MEAGRIVPRDITEARPSIIPDATDSTDFARPWYCDETRREVGFVAEADGLARGAEEKSFEYWRDLAVARERVRGVEVVGRSDVTLALDEFPRRGCDAEDGRSAD